MSLQNQQLTINPFIIQKTFSSYSDSSSFLNYQKICRDYYKLYYKIFRKYNNVPKDKLRNEVKHWFFNQSLENRIKLCTVENEFFCQIIYQMYLYTQSDHTVKFYPKSELIDIYEIDKNILNDYSEKKDFDLEKYFKCKSEQSAHLANSYNLYSGEIYPFEEEENDQKYNSSIKQFINEIIFYSVHHRPYPDCFCLSPCFLMKEERFDTSFNFLGNISYFTSLIEPLCFNQKSIYGYKLPFWISSSYSYSITQYIFAFIEQTILVKFILNNYSIYNNKKNNHGKNNKSNTTIFSLINDEILNSIFIDRKTVINYLNINYNNINSKKELVNDANIKNIFDEILKNNDIMNKITYFKNFIRDKNYNGFAGSMLVQPLLGIKSNNIINTLYDNINSFFIHNPEEQNNIIINKINSDIDKIIEENDNIIFTDNLLFGNFNELWEFNYFIYIGVIEYIINLFKEKNYNDLLKEEIPTKKKNRKKKKKKNQNNNNEIKDNNENNKIGGNTQNNNKENENEKEKENKIYNIDLECYNEIFKDKEKLLYIPYYFKIDIELKTKFKKVKENKLKLIEKNNKKKDIKEIINYIKNEFILKYLIDKVIHLQPDNYVSFFENNIEKDENSKNKDFKINKIHGLKLRKSKTNNFIDNDNFGTITINLNPKNNNIINNEILINNDIYKDEGKKIEKNISKNKDNKIRSNSLDKKYKNNFETKINNNLIDNNKINEFKENIIEQNKNIRNNNNSSNKNSNKKREKSPNIFFLFDTIKNKKKKKPKSKSPNNTKSEKNKLEISFNPSNIKYIKSDKDNHLFFIEKLHNNILKNEIKVNNILQFLMKFKNYCVEEVKKIIVNTYNNLLNYTIDLYGSFITGLMIEASDIDIRIKISESYKKDLEKYFFILHDKLKEQKKFESIIPISTASVPVIKLILNIENFINNEKELEKDFNKFKQSPLFKNFSFDKKELTHIKIDITYIINYSKNDNNLEISNKMQNDKLNINKNNNSLETNDNEISSISYIKKSIEEYPEIKPILKLLKRYFYIKKMNSSFEGGLSSYNLFLLILSYAKYQKIFNLNPYKKINLGFFLIQFLEFFGKIFDFKNYLINFNSPYIYELNNFINYNSKSLVILDPITGANASKSSYKIGEIQTMFLNAYEFFEKEKINYDYEMIKNERNDKRDNDKKNNFEEILGLAKVNKHDYNKKNNKDNKINSNIIDKFFFS